MKEAPALNTNSSALKSTSDILNLHAAGSNVYGRNRGRLNNLDTSYRVEKCNSLNQQHSKGGREKDLIERIQEKLSIRKEDMKENFIPALHESISDA